MKLLLNSAMEKNYYNQKNKASYCKVEAKLYMSRQHFKFIQSHALTKKLILVNFYSKFKIYYEKGAMIRTQSCDYFEKSRLGR